MRRLLLPFFIVRLLLVLTPFFLSVLMMMLYPLRSFLITLLFFLYFAIVLGKTLTTLSPTQQPSNFITIEPLNNDTELQKWLSLYEQQPTHRDVLLNLSLLYSAEGDEENARKFLLKAREVDPNYQYPTTNIQ